MRVPQERNRMGWTQIDQHGIRLLQYKLEAITKIDTPKNEKDLKFFFGANAIPFELYKKLVSKHG